MRSLNLIKKPNIGITAYNLSWAPNQQPASTDIPVRELFWTSSTDEPLDNCSQGYESYRAHNRFPNLGIYKGTENPQGIWLWRTVGFDYRTSTGLEKQTLGGNKALCTPGARRKEQRLSQTCLWVSRSLWWREQTTGREHSPVHRQKIGLKIYWAWLHPSE